MRSMSNIQHGIVHVKSRNRIVEEEEEKQTWDHIRMALINEDCGVAECSI